MGKPSQQVFINAPFDVNFKPIFDSVVFTVVACGYEPRCGLESGDGGTPRISRLCAMIGDCKMSIHDLSRIQLDKGSGLPRFNMPFEFGVFIGAREFGGKNHRQKVCLVLAEKQFDYQKYISDIAGQDISMHGNAPAKAIAKVRDFLRGHTSRSIPGSKIIIDHYKLFEKDIPRLANLDQFKYDPEDLHFKDYLALAGAFLLDSGWKLSN
jgi:hypothetical protein